jgi:hypothetical protein
VADGLPIRAQDGHRISTGEVSVHGIKLGRGTL